MDQLAYEPPTAPTDNDSSSHAARYIYEQATHQLSTSLQSPSTPPPPTPSAPMALPHQPHPYFQDSWSAYHHPLSPVNHLDPHRRSTTTSDAVLTRSTAIPMDHSAVENHHQVFSHLPYDSQLPSQQSDEHYHHQQQSLPPQGYRHHMSSTASYPHFPSASTRGSASPTNSVGSGSGRPSTGISTLQHQSYSSPTLSLYPKAPPQQQWMTYQDPQQHAYHSADLNIDSSLRHGGNGLIHHPPAPGSMTMRVPSASPEPDSTAPRSPPIADLHHQSNRERSDSNRTSTSASGPHHAPHQAYSNPQSSPGQYIQYQGYRNSAPLYSPFALPPHAEMAPHTPTYQYPPPPALSRNPSSVHAPTNPSPPVMTANAAPSSSAPAPPPAPPVQPSNPPRSSKTKTKLTDMDRKFICVFAASHPKARQEDIATKFAVERSTVSKILKSKDKWMKVDFFSSEARTVKHRPSKFPEIESELIHHIRLRLASRETINDAFIKKTALALADDRGIGRDKFKASSGWVENFKHRHDIRRGGVFSSGDRPGAIPIPGAVLSVPGTGGSLPGDGSNVVIGPPMHAVSINEYPYESNDPISGNGFNGDIGSYDMGHMHGGILPMGVAGEHIPGVGLSDEFVNGSKSRSGMTTRSMRSESFSSQRDSVVSAEEGDDADVPTARGRPGPYSGGENDEYSSPASHVAHEAPRNLDSEQHHQGEYGRHESDPASYAAQAYQRVPLTPQSPDPPPQTLNEDQNFAQRDLPSSRPSTGHGHYGGVSQRPHLDIPVANEPFYTSPPAHPSGPEGAYYAGNSRPSSAISRSDSSYSMVSHPSMPLSPRLAHSPTSLPSSYYVGSPVESPGPLTQGPGSPMPTRSMSASLSSSQGVEAPSASAPSVNGRGQMSHRTSGAAVASPRSLRYNPVKGPRSSNRRSVTFSGYSPGTLIGRAGPASPRLSMLNEDGPRMEVSGMNSTRFDLNRGYRSHPRSTLFLDVPISHTSLGSSTSSNNSFTSQLSQGSADRSLPASPQSTSEMGFMTMPLVDVHNRAVGEPVIAEYGADEHHHEGRITGEPRLMLGQLDQLKGTIPTAGGGLAQHCRP